MIASKGTKVSRSETTQQELHCLRCGYSRTGLPNEAACPECGYGLLPPKTITCRTLAPFADDVSLALLLGLAIPGLGFLYLGRAFNRVRRDQRLRHICKMAVTNDRTGLYTKPASLTITWVICLLLGCGALIGTSMVSHGVESVGALSGAAVTAVEGAKHDAAALTRLQMLMELLHRAISDYTPLLRAVVIICFSLPCIATVAALGKWHVTALHAARLSTVSAEGPVALTLISGILFVLLLLSLTAWPGDLQKVDSRVLLMPLSLTVLALGWWAMAWYRLSQTLRREGELHR